MNDIDEKRDAVITKEPIQNYRGKSSITVSINGKDRALPQSYTISALLSELNIDPLKVAVEINKKIALREEFNNISLNHGDRIEIVSFVGGG